MQVRLADDTLTPTLVSLQTRLRDRRACYEAIGLFIVSVTKRAHTDASLRPHVWPPLADGSPSTLQKTTQMRRSWRITSVGNDGVTVGSDREYAAVHFFGGDGPYIIRPKNGKALRIPVGGGNFVFRAWAEHPGNEKRRAMPVEEDGRLTPHAEKGVETIIVKKLAQGH